jgi:hypothetical protein
VRKFELTPDHQRWASAPVRTSRYRHPKKYWLELIAKQRGLCAFSRAPLLFSSADGTPVKGGQSQHPIYAVVDHRSPGSDSLGHQIVSNDLNDLKGHLNPELFDALRRTKEWKRLMRRWRAQAVNNPRDREAFRAIRRGGV